MPASLFRFRQWFHRLCCHFNVWNLGSACSFIVLTDSVSTNAFVTAFQFSVREIVTQEPAFSLWIGRIALIITIKMATIKNPFLAVSIAVRQFPTPQLYQSRKNPSQPPLAAAGLITASWQRIAKKKVITAISTASFGVSTRIVLFLYFRYTLLVMFINTPLKFRNTSSIFSAATVLLLSSILSRFLPRTLLACGLPSVIHKYRIRSPDFFP